MAAGTILAIHLAPQEGADPVAVQEAHVVPGKGIAGDRNYLAAEAGKLNPGSEITFIEEEALVALEREYEIQLAAADSRRNVLTQGIALNHLVGVRFRAGSVLCKGFELCEPCGYLEKKTQKGVLRGLIHRGGLRAHVLEEGTIKPGDTVEVA